MMLWPQPEPTKEYGKLLGRGVEAHEAGENARLWTGPLRSALATRRKNALSCFERAMLMRAATGAMWIAREVRARGKQVDATCKPCGEHEGSV